MTTVQEKLTFEDEQVDVVQVKITKAGDGLSEALKFAPKALAHGTRVAFVLEGEVAGVNFKHDKKSDALIRIHVIETSGITEIDLATAKTMLGDAALQLAKAKEAADGQLALDAENAAMAKEALD